MDLKYWGFSEAPFRPTISPTDACPSPSHDHALEKLAFALSCREPLHLLTGEHGLGKTTLARRLALVQDQYVSSTVWISCSPNSTTTELLYAILSDLGNPGESMHLAALRARLLDQTLCHQEKKLPSLLVCDNAHHLPTSALAELRLLADLITADGMAHWMILLCGHTSLKDKLLESNLDELRMNLGAIAELHPLPWEEADAFLRQQLLRAGGVPESQVSSEAWSLLAQLGHGIPRNMNRLARYAFHYAEMNSLVQVDAEAVLEAANDLRMTQSSAFSTHAVDEEEESAFMVSSKKSA